MSFFSEASQYSIISRIERLAELTDWIAHRKISLRSGRTWMFDCLHSVLQLKVKNHNKIVQFNLLFFFFRLAMILLRRFVATWIWRLKAITKNTACSPTSKHVSQTKGRKQTKTEWKTLESLSWCCSSKLCLVWNFTNKFVPFVFLCFKLCQRFCDEGK